VRFMINPTSLDSAYYWAVSDKNSLGDSNDLGGRTTQSTLRGTFHTPVATRLINSKIESISKPVQAASIRYESGKPMIITDFSILATSQLLQEGKY
jgi:molybdopterin biosynthesis enzyme MoaB